MMTKSNRRRDEERRAAAAAKVAEMRREQQLAERRKRAWLISGVVVVAIAVVVALFAIVATRGSSSVSATANGSGATADFGFVVGESDAPVTIVAYEDFQCPNCKNFEATMGDTVAKNVQDGTLKVEYRPVAFLSKYSTRALNAAVCVHRAGGADAFSKFHNLLFTNQPPEGGDGLPNSQLITYANQALGTSSPAVEKCINDGTFDDWASSATDSFSKATANYPSGPSTPTLVLNGQVMTSDQLASPESFQAAIDQAADAS